MNVDLHTHSTASDGTLPPAAVVARAVAAGVAMLALTDHDETAGLEQACAAARCNGIALVPGVEVSVTWRGSTVHVVGLGIDPVHPGLNAGLARLRAGRLARAETIARALAAAGISGCMAGALALAPNPAMIGRTHFARFLVARGIAADLRAVFRAYLSPGKPGYVAHRWATLDEAVGWIRAAGGVAVLAHPARYPFSSDVVHALLTAFLHAGGEAIEVVAGSHSAGDAREFGALALRYGMQASRASDFHAPAEGAEPGGLPALDPRLSPVWARFEH